MIPIKEILVLHHSHTDIGYTHPQPVVWELHKRFIDQAIDLCEQTADWADPSRLRWTCEVTSTLQYWLRHSPSRQIERFRRLVAAGQMGAGAMFNNLTPLCDAEQLSRMLLPIKEMRDTLGLAMTVAINQDVNGLPWPLTQLLLDAGVEMLLMGINIHSGGFPLTRPLAFRWRGCDGRDLLAFNGEHYDGFEREARLKTPSLQAMADGFKAYFARLDKLNYPHDFVFLTATHPTFTDNAGPNPMLVEMVRKWNAEDRQPLIRFVTPEMLLARLKQLPPAALATHGGDWTDYWNFGSASSAVETRLSREARMRLLSAETLMSRQAGEPPHRVLELMQQAKRHLDIYDEHTWGAWCSICNPDADITLNQWAHKAYNVHQAWSLAEFLEREALQQLSHNPLTGNGVKSVLFYNSAPSPRRACMSVPKSWLDGTWEHCDNSVYRFNQERETWSAEQMAVVGPIELPASGCVALRVSQLPVAVAPEGCVLAPGRLESPYYVMEFDAGSGRITGLLDKQLGRQVIDSTSPWPLFGFVQETVDPSHIGKPYFKGRDAFFPEDWAKLLVNQSCWNPDWQASRKGPVRLIQCQPFSAPQGVGLVLEWEAPGVENLLQTITLCGHRPVIEFQATFHKTDVRTAEGLYFVFPLALSSTWRAHFDTAGLPVEFDSEQLPGVCRDYVTAGQWVAMHDEVMCVTLACPDAPLVQIGDFSFGKEQKQVLRHNRPLLLSWPVNNYWTTNFRASQPGFMKFRYELSTHPSFDAATSTVAGLEAACPVEVHPVLAEQMPPALHLIDVSPAGVIPLHLKRSGDGNDLMVLLANVTEKSLEASVRLPGYVIGSVVLSNALEQAGLPLVVGHDEFKVTIKSRSLVNIRISPLRIK